MLGELQRTMMLLQYSILGGHTISSSTLSLSHLLALGKNRTVNEQTDRETRHQRTRVEGGGPLERVREGVGLWSVKDAKLWS